jgi:co-chaperonin GroES (HSP10)
VKFYPKNRHLLIETQKQEETDTGVLLPEGYHRPKDKYVVATVLDTATDCKDHPTNGTKVVVDATMVETVSVLGTEYEIVLENHIVGLMEYPE